MSKRITQEDFLKSCIKVHGDKYNYSLVKYTRKIDKIKIICPIHGEFEQVARVHENGCGCNKCGSDRRSKAFSRTHQEFLSDLKQRQPKIFSDIISFKTKYVSNHKKIIVEVNYGFCSVSPASLLSGKIPTIDSACDKTNFFLNKLNCKFDGILERYDFSNTKYIDTLSDIKFICNTHGEISTKPQYLLRNGLCSKCEFENRDHSGYSYYNIKLAERNKNEWIKINCLVYLIKCFDLETCEEFYKIGFTKQSLKKRLRNDKFPYSYDVLKIIKTNLYDAILIESELHSISSDYSYLPNKTFDGYTECFSNIENALSFEEVYFE